MLRLSVFLLFTAVISCGCTDLRPTSADMYCLVDTGGFCAEIQGSGDCQPCPPVALTDKKPKDADRRPIRPDDKPVPPPQAETPSS